VALALPEPFAAVRRTVNAPGEEYTWPGFCSVACVPSPKSQFQDVGAPPDVSVKRMREPAAGFGVEAVNAAEGAAGARAPATEARIDRTGIARVWKAPERFIHPEHMGPAASGVPNLGLLKLFVLQQFLTIPERDPYNPRPP